VVENYRVVFRMYMLLTWNRNQSIPVLASSSHTAKRCKAGHCEKWHDAAVKSLIELPICNYSVLETKILFSLMSGLWRILCILHNLRMKTR